MATITLYGQYDATLRENAPTTSQESVVGNLAGYSSTTAFFFCIKYDLSGFNAADIITLAKLRFNIYGEVATSTSTLSAYRILRAWTESATWNTYNGSNNWGTAGCNNTTTDREAAAVGTVARGTADTGWHEITITTPSKLKEMFDGTMTNNGFLIRDANSTSTPSVYYYETRNNFYSTGNLPELYVEYTSGIPNIKTVNSVANADIKTVNGIPVADIKSLQGLFSGEWLRKLDMIKKGGLWQPQNSGLITI